MTQLAPELETIGRQLHLAYSARLRRRRRVRLGTVAACAVLTFGGAAYASGVAGDLGLDPTKWEILSGGTVEGGKASWARATSIEDGRPSTFMVEHDAGMDRYDAFLLHEQTLDAAGGSPESGARCTREEPALQPIRAGPAGAARTASRSLSECSPASSPRRT